MRRAQRKRQAKKRKKQRDESAQFATTQRLHNEMLKRVSAIGDGLGLAEAPAPGSAIVTILDAKDRVRVVRRLTDLRRDCHKAADALESSGHRVLPQSLRDDVELIGHLIETYFAPVPGD